jgi:hypothetical protein
MHVAPLITIWTSPPQSALAFAGQLVAPTRVMVVQRVALLGWTMSPSMTAVGLY